MFSIVHHDQTRTTFKQTFQPRTSSHSGGFFNLNFQTAAMGGFTSASFEIGSLPIYGSNRIVCYDSMELWSLGQKVWTGRVKNPVRKTSSGSYLVELEGIGVAWGKDRLMNGTYTAGSPTANNYASQIYAYLVANAPINLLNSSTANIGATAYAISNRTWQEQSFEEVFNDINNFHGFWWGVGIYADNSHHYIGSNSNKFYYQDLRNAAATLTWVVDYNECANVEIAADMEDYANSVRVRWGSSAANYTDSTDTASQAKYTPSYKREKSFNIQTGASTANTTDAANVGAAWLNRRKVDGVVEPWVKGSVTLRGSKFYTAERGGNLPAYMVKAGSLIRIQGLMGNQPELSNVVDESTVFLITATDYDDETGENIVTLNDSPPDINASLARLEARG